jgi:hypothetical protein
MPGPGAQARRRQPRAGCASPELEAAIELAHRAGRDGLVERWRELEHRAEALGAARGAFAAGVADLRGRSPAAASPAPGHEALLRDATTGAPEAARRALTALARDPDPALVALLTDRSPPVRRAAAEVLVHVGAPSRGALRHALAGARPDRRGIQAEVFERLGGRRYVTHAGSPSSYRLPMAGAPRPCGDVG